MSRLAGVVVRAMNHGHFLALLPAWRRFAAAADDPRAAQEERLRAALRRLPGTAFARAHPGLERARTLGELQAAVPVRDMDAFAPWVARMVAGEPDVLLREPLLCFEPSSGSTAAAKWVPYTRGLIAEFSAATGAWLFDLLRRRPTLCRSTAYWSLSPLARRPARTPGGTPIGLADDTEYLPAPVRGLVRRLLPVPPAVARLETVEACRRASLHYLLADPRLGFVSVWSPSFLSLLLAQARADRAALAEGIARGVPAVEAPPGLLPPTPPDPARAALVLDALATPGPAAWAAIWPRWALVSCWADAGAARLVPELRAELPRTTELQPKGLLATEGVVSIPLLGQEGGVLALGSHLLELEPVDGGPAVAAHQAEVGGRYAPVLTTAGGLTRYRLRDEVLVLGRWRRAPRVRFLGRLDGGSDLAGEKLSPSRVEVALAAALALQGAGAGSGRAPRFALLAPLPRERPPCYALFLEAGRAPLDPERLARELEAELALGPHYAQCRALGQLGPVRVTQVRDGARRFEEALVARGQQAGAIKPPSLHPGDFWGEVLGSSR